MNDNTVALSHNEVLKTNCPSLAGTLAPTLADPALDHFSADDEQFLKFHGCYQQDDRDLRKTGKKYIMMIRTRSPGGVTSAAQYLVFDRLATQYGNNTLRITTRQGIQFHHVVKNNLRAVIHELNEALVTTIAACGDVARNVMAPPAPARTAAGAQLLADAKRISDAVIPQTRAYHEIWVNGNQLDLAGVKADAVPEDELYGRTYLPRKFKIGLVLPPLNDVDIFTNCCGFIGIEENGQLVGYNLTAGGGMGRSHNNAATFPRLADVIGFLPADQVVNVTRAVISMHRDFGDRTNRKHARLKYVLEDRGVEWFRAEMEKRIGFKFGAARPFNFVRQGDAYGWGQGHDGKWFLGLFVQDGRIQDAHGTNLKTALREIAEQVQPEFRFTPAENVILAGLSDAQKAATNAILAKHGINPDKQGTPTQLASMSCVALPTCGLALAESERIMPEFVAKVDALLAEVGLPNEELIIRITGCPNGCARPYMAEIALVGRAPQKYQLYVGGNEPSTRLARVLKDNVAYGAVLDELRPLLVRFKAERNAGERFGDWCARTVWTELNLPARS
jgi:sulfite reductase (NADPH) hemoprotein beta-component